MHDAGEHGAMNEYQRSVFEFVRPEGLFAVVSWGRAATGWVSRVLNSHPAVFCVHSIRSALNVFGYPGQDAPDGVRLMRLIASMGQNYKVAGDVHEFARQDIPALRGAFGSAFRTAVIIRDPLPRLRSMVSHYHQLPKQTWSLGHVDEMLASKGLTLPADDDELRMFANGASLLNAILEEVEVGDVYRSEDLTSSSEVLGRFLDHVTGGLVDIDRAWLKQSVRSDRVNPHSNAGDGAQLTQWQVEVLRRVVEPAAWQLYEEFGYRRSALL